MRNLFITLLDMSIVGAYVTAFVLIARLFLKKAPKIFSYIIWSVVFFRLLCPFSFESVMSIVAVKPERITVGQTAAPPMQDYTLPLGSVSEVHYITSDAIAEHTKSTVDITTIFSYIWIVGAAAMIIYSLISYAMLKYRLKNARPLDENIYISGNISTAFLMGFFSPKIYLPDFIAEEERRYVILHEKTHQRRKDHIFKVIMYFALCIHWFNPAVWLAFCLAVKDMEMSCDEAVLKENGSIRKDYSRSILKLSAGRRISAVPLAFGESDVKGRIKNVLNYKKPAFWVIIICSLAAVILTICLISNPKNNDGWDVNNAQAAIEEYSGYRNVKQFKVIELENDRYIVGFTCGEENNDFGVAGIEKINSEYEIVSCTRQRGMVNESDRCAALMVHFADGYIFDVFLCSNPQLRTIEIEYEPSLSSLEISPEEIEIKSSQNLMTLEVIPDSNGLSMTYNPDTPKLYNSCAISHFRFLDTNGKEISSGDNVKRTYKDIGDIKATADKIEKGISDISAAVNATYGDFSESISTIDIMKNQIEEIKARLTEMHSEAVEEEKAALSEEQTRAERIEAELTELESKCKEATAMSEQMTAFLINDLTGDSYTYFDKNTDEWMDIPAKYIEDILSSKPEYIVNFSHDMFTDSNFVILNVYNGDRAFGAYSISKGAVNGEKCGIISNMMTGMYHCYKFPLPVYEKFLKAVSGNKVNASPYTVTAAERTEIQTLLSEFKSFSHDYIMAYKTKDCAYDEYIITSEMVDGVECQTKWYRVTSGDITTLEELKSRMSGIFTAKMIDRVNIDKIYCAVDNQLYLSEYAESTIDLSGRYKSYINSVGKADEDTYILFMTAIGSENISVDFQIQLKRINDRFKIDVCSVSSTDFITWTYSPEDDLI